MVRKRNRNGTELLRRQMDMFREDSFGSESQSRPEEISEKLISIQTDTVGCRGGVQGLWWGLNEYLSENLFHGWHIHAPIGCGKGEEDGGRWKQPGAAPEAQRDVERERKREERGQE